MQSKKRDITNEAKEGKIRNNLQEEKISVPIIINKVKMNVLQAQSYTLKADITYFIYVVSKHTLKLL